MMRLLNQAQKKIKNSLGDTLIEVIIGIAVLGSVMAVAYISTTHSLQVGTDAGSRGRALGFVQQQVEQIKNAEQKNNLSGYIANPGQPFCAIPATGVIVRVNPGGHCTVCTDKGGNATAYIDPSIASCPADSSPAFSLGTVFNSSNHVFTVNASWGASNGSGSGQLVLYYKLAS